MTDARFSAAAERNQRPILDVLRHVLPARGLALEIASGTGQHAAFFAAAMPGWTWQPSDADAVELPGIDARIAADGLTNVRAALHLDVMAPEWPAPGRPFRDSFDAIYCANMLHISPWPTCAGLMQGSARCLAADGVLVTYGPYLEGGTPTAPGNLAFDASLRARDGAWGIRQLADVVAEAHRAGLQLRHRHQMPANNLMLEWVRQAK